MTVAAASLMAFTLMTACGDRTAVEFSVAPTQTIAVSKQAEGILQFVRQFELGVEEGDSTKEFGMIFAAAWTPHGDIIVGDATLSKIVQFDRRGILRNSYGLPGSGPGEFLSVDRILANDTAVVIYDDRQHRVSLFDTTADFRSSFQPRHGPVSDMDFGPGGELLLLVGAFNGRRMIYRYSLNGEVIDSFGSGPYLPPGLQRGPTGLAGALCVSGQTVFYANAYIPELAAYRAPSYGLKWAKHYSSKRRFSESSVPGNPASLNDILAGMVCDSSKIMLAHVEVEAKAIHYELYDSAGFPLARLTENTTGVRPYAGFLAGLRGDSILAYSNRPFAKVRVYGLARR